MGIKIVTCVISSVFFLLCLISCDPIFYLTINTQDSITISLECGTIVLTIATMGGVNYHLKQEYSLNKKIIINTRAINVEFKGKIVEYKLLDDKGIIKNDFYAFNGKKTLVLDFVIQDIVNKDDVIEITAPNYITCEGNSVSLEKLTIQINREFK